MARLTGKPKANSGLSVTKQLAFHPLLLAARKTKLHGAAAEAAAACDQKQLRTQLSRSGSTEVMTIAAASGIRDEFVIATPCLLEQKPTVLGYYRLLAGLSRKQFYSGSIGFGSLALLEEGGTIKEAHRSKLEPVCRALNALIAEMVTTLDTTFSFDDVRDLPLLQFGAQLDGANRVKIGEAASQEVFSCIADLLRTKLKRASAKTLEVLDATGVSVFIVQATDPDLSIIRKDGSLRPRTIAVEIKGGTDLSNAHNRAGEAEKSHLKAKGAGATDFWTIASLPNKSIAEFKKQSPTTGAWFDLSEILGRAGPSWDEFARQLAAAVGVRLW